MFHGAQHRSTGRTRKRASRLRGINGARWHRALVARLACIRRVAVALARASRIAWPRAVARVARHQQLQSSIVCSVLAKKAKYA